MSGLTLVPRHEVVRALAGHLADRDHWVLYSVGTDLNRLPDFGTLPDYTGYLDNGTALVMRVRPPNWPLITVTCAMMPPLALRLLLTVPKTVGADTLTELLGTTVPADGSQDIIGMGDDEQPTRYYWPALFVDAVRLVDPAAAAQLAANDIRGLS